MSQLVGRGLFKRRGKRQALKGVDISLNQGQMVGLFGANGSGKTTLLSLLTGLLSPDAGSVYLNGQDIGAYSVDRRALLGISYLAQEPSVFSRLTVSENLESILERREDLSKQERQEKKERVIEQLHLGDFLTQRADTLSGGQRRRTEVARALMRDPLFFLLDEPFAGVDPKSMQEVMEILFKLKELGMGIFITDHNVKEALPLTERAYILHEGVVLAEGDQATLLKDPNVRKFYWGEGFSL
jgi:lipopolysaccharide export system ATP-binding protein